MIVRVFFLALMVSAVQAKDTWNNPPKEKLAGMEHRTFQSRSMHTVVGYNVCLPPEYAREPNRRFPVIYYLHGYEGNESSYLDYAQYWREALRQTGPCLLVFVNGGESSFFSDSPDGTVMGETVMAKELVPEIDSAFRTESKPSSRALHGYSMGGFGALKLAFTYPDLFGSAVAYGATLSTDQEMRKHLGKVYNKMFGSTDRFQANDPARLAQAHAAELQSKSAVLLVVGTKDEFLDANRRLNSQIKALKIASDCIELPGVKHDKDALYKAGAAQVFDFTAKRFHAAQPVKH